MVRGNRLIRRRRGGTVRAIGAALAVLALALQTLLPLADARWHAARATIPDDFAILAFDTAGAAGPQTPDQHPATTDRLCQLCIGLHATSAPPPAGGVPLIAPIAYHTTEPSRVTDAAPSQLPGEVHQPRAPPIQA